MIRNDAPGTNEAWTTASRSALLRNALFPATRPVGARFAQTGTLPSSTMLDRPGVPYMIQAMTARLRPSKIDPYGTAITDSKVPYFAETATPLLVDGCDPYVFAAYGPGTLRAIRCRDYVFGPPVRDTATSDTIVRIEVLRRDATNTSTLETVLSGALTAHTVPFDISDLDVTVGGYGHDTFTVRARRGDGSGWNYILSVEFEFSMNLAGGV